MRPLEFLLLDDRNIHRFNIYFRFFLLKMFVGERKNRRKKELDVSSVDTYPVHLNSFFSLNYFYKSYV